jgi:hypothetical protein
MLSAIVDPYAKRLMEVEQLLNCAVGDIRNQETVLTNL